MAQWIASLSDNEYVILLILYALPIFIGIIFVLCCEISFPTPPLGGDRVPCITRVMIAGGELETAGPGDDPALDGRHHQAIGRIIR